LKGAVLALLLALAAPAIADDWSRYENARFAYALDVPPGFAGRGESDNGDGQVFATPTAQLRVHGAHILASNFEHQVKALQRAAVAAGWTITYETTTPRWASYSGTQGGRVFYARAIALCAGALAEFSLTYGKADSVAFNPIVERLARSLRPAGTC
jgi:hypothetical protein